MTKKELAQREQRLSAWTAEMEAKNKQLGDWQTKLYNRETDIDKRESALKERERDAELGKAIRTVSEQLGPRAPWHPLQPWFGLR